MEHLISIRSAWIINRLLTGVTTLIIAATELLTLRCDSGLLIRPSNGIFQWYDRQSSFVGR